MDLLKRLLDVNESTRLGSGPHGESDLKTHAFFAGMDWDKLEHRQVRPPVIPESRCVGKMQRDLKSVLAMHDKEHWLEEVPDQEFQVLFQNW